MTISFDQIRPQSEGRRSPLYMALMLRHIADQEVGKMPGVENHTRNPRVWVHITKPMLRGEKFTGEEGFAGASERARHILRLLIPAVERYLAMPHIMDNFPNHAERREWGEKHIARYGADLMQFYKKNPLSINVLLSLQTGIEYAAGATSELSCEEAQYLRATAAGLGRPHGLPDLRKLFSGVDPKSNEFKIMKYDRMPPNEKWRIACEYEAFCRELVEKIAVSTGLKRERSTDELEWISAPPANMESS